MNPKSLISLSRNIGFVKGVLNGLVHSDLNETEKNTVLKLAHEELEMAQDIIEKAMNEV